MKKRILAAVTAAVMLMSCAFAETVKSERVFAVADAAGNIRSVTDVVLLKNEDNLETLTDLTALTGIENVSGSETFKRDGETIIWNAAGNDIRYQGSGKTAPAVMPVVTLELDGAAVTPAELSGKSGRLTIRVDYTSSGAPALALTALVVPSGMTNIVTENAVLMDGQLILGCAVPGADEALGLPAGFTVTCDADRVSLSWMMTFLSSDPLSLLADKAAEYTDSAEALANQLIPALTALKDGTEMPETEGSMGEMINGLAALIEGADSLAGGAAALNTGAASLAEGAETAAKGASDLSAGAASLDSGAATLETGLTTLAANSEALNAGAAQLFNAVLNTANQQLAASGLEAAGITIPELTQENYAAVLDAVTEQLTTAINQAPAQAEAQVRAAVTAQEAEIRTAVTQAVRDNVLAAVLKSAGIELAEGQAVPAAITQAVDEQMKTDEIKAAIEENVNAKIEALVQQNLGSEAVQAQISEATLTAQAAIDSLAALKARLDQVNSFVSGLAAYTEGVSQAQAGSASLHEGTSQLAAGAATLSEGVTALSTGSSELSTGAAALSEGASQLNTGINSAVSGAADKLLSLLDGDAGRYLSAFSGIRESLDGASGYDLCAEGMSLETVYIIRTDLK